MNNISKLSKIIYSSTFVGVLLTLTLALSSASYFLDELKNDFEDKNHSLIYQLNTKIKFEELALEVAFRLSEKIDMDNIFHILKSNDFDLYYLNKQGQILYSATSNPNFNPMIEFVFLNLLEKGIEDKQVHILSIERNKRDLLMIRKDVAGHDGYLLGKMNIEKLFSNINIDKKFVVYDDSGYVIKSNNDDINPTDNINAKFAQYFSISNVYFFYSNGCKIGFKTEYNDKLYILTYIDVYDLLFDMHLYLFLGFLFLLTIYLMYIKKIKAFIKFHYIDVIINIVNVLKNEKNTNFKPCTKKGDDLYVLESSIEEKLSKNNDFLEYIDELENRLRSFFSENQVPMLTVNSYTGQIINANEAAIEFYGYDKTDLLQKTLYSLNVKSTSSIAYNVYDSVKNRQNYIKAQHVIKKGDKFDVKDVRVYPFSINSKVRYDYLMIIDFTEIDRNLKWIDNEKFYFKYGPVSAIYLDIDSNNDLIIKDVYQKHGNVFGGNKKQDIINKSYYDLFIGGKNIISDDNFNKKYNLIKQRELKAFIDKINLGGKNMLLEQSIFFKNRHNADMLYKVHYRFITDKDFKVSKVIAFILDFNTGLYDDKKVEILEECFENPTSALMMLGCDGRVLAINSKMALMFGLDKDKLLDSRENILDNEDIDKSVIEILRVCMERNMSMGDLLKIQTKDGMKNVLLSIISSELKKDTYGVDPNYMGDSLMYKDGDKTQADKRNFDIMQYYMVTIDPINRSFGEIKFSNRHIKSDIKVSKASKTAILVLELLRLIDAILYKNDINSFSQDDLQIFVDYANYVISIQDVEVHSDDSMSFSDILNDALEICIKCICTDEKDAYLLAKLDLAKKELLKYI